MLQHKRFFDFFPPPDFLAMPAVGIDISDRSVHFAELLHGRKTFELGRYGEEKIPAGIITEGVIKDSHAMKKILIALRRKYKLSFVRVSLPEQKGYLVKIKVPKMKKSNLRESLELQLENYVPISPQSAIFDYSIVTCPTDDTQNSDVVGVAVMPADTVEQYVKIFEGTGLLPLSFELEAHAIARAVIDDGDCGTYMIVDIGGTRTGFSIVSEGIVRFTATINIGGKLFTEAVMKTYGLSKKEATQKKEKEGLLHTEGDESMHATLISGASVLLDEVKKWLIYWDTQTANSDNRTRKKIERVILCGGEANVPGLRSYFSVQLKTPVVLANPWRNIVSFDEYIPTLPYNHSLRYTTALGLALRSHLL